MPDIIPSHFDTTAEILAFIHNLYIKKHISQEEDTFTARWDCVNVGGIYHFDRDNELNEWSDAAHRGDWDTIFRIAVDATWEGGFGRYINSPRLQQQRMDTEGERRLDELPTGYTALHHAAWHGAPIEIVRGLIELGASRGIRTTDGKHQRPLDIACEKGHDHLFSILTPRLLPQVSDAVLAQVEAQFHKVIFEETRGSIDKEMIRLPDLGILRDQPRVTMVARMPGGHTDVQVFKFWWEDRYLVCKSHNRRIGGYWNGFWRTRHITTEDSTVVSEVPVGM